METALITLTDILVYRQIDRQINATNLAGHILSVQRNQLRELLGDNFYYAVLNDVLSFTTLISGENYTFEGNPAYYFGLKPFIVFHVLSSLLSDNNLKISDAGNINLLDSSFSKASAGEIREARQEYQSQAMNYRNNIIDYLDTKNSTYPLWTGKAQRPNIDFDFQII